MTNAAFQLLKTGDIVTFRGRPGGEIMPITYAGDKCPYCFLRIPHTQDQHDKALAEHRKKNGPALPAPGEREQAQAAYKQWEKDSKRETLIGRWLK